VKDDELATLNEILKARGYETLSAFVHSLVDNPQDAVTLSKVEKSLASLSGDVTAIRGLLTSYPANVDNRQEEEAPAARFELASPFERQLSRLLGYQVTHTPARPSRQ
jgi:hypothetical protein